MKIPVEGFTRKSVAKLTGLKPATISYYVANKYITPGELKSTTAGSPSKFSLHNVFEFFLLKKLSANGLSLGQIQVIIWSLWPKAKGIDFAIKTNERLSAGGEINKSWIDKTYASIEKRDLFKLAIDRNQRMFLLLFDKDSELKVCFSEFKEGDESCTTGDQLHKLISSCKYLPESFSNVIIVSIHELVFEVMDNLKKL